jgi:hypothetical protein
MSEFQKFTEDEFGFEFQFPSSLVINPTHKGTTLELKIFSEYSNQQIEDPLGSPYQY